MLKRMHNKGNACEVRNMVEMERNENSKQDFLDLIIFYFSLKFLSLFDKESQTFQSIIEHECVGPVVKSL